MFSCKLDRQTASLRAAAAKRSPRMMGKTKRSKSAKLIVSPEKGQSQQSEINNEKSGITLKTNKTTNALVHHVEI